MYKIINDEIIKQERTITCEEYINIDKSIIRCFTFPLNKSNDEILKTIKELYIIYNKETQPETVVVKDNLTDTIFEVN